MKPAIGRQRHLPDDHMSGNWSLGSNYHPCSQSRKMSIGVVVDSVAKTKGKNGKGVTTELQSSQNVTSAKEFPTESKQKEKEVITSPDLVPQNKQFSPFINPKKVPSFPSTSNVTLQPNKTVNKTNPDSIFETPMFNPHSNDANGEKSKKNNNQSEEVNHGVNGSKEQAKEVTEKVTSEKVNNGNVTLRMKVQELLGSVYTPNKKPNNSDSIKTSDNKSNPKSEGQHKSEINSGSLNKRPVTRSFINKKPETEKSVPKPQVPLYRYKEGEKDKNVFSFEDVNQGSKMSKRKERDTEGVQKDARKRKGETVKVSLFENRSEKLPLQPNTILKNNKDQDSFSKSSLKKNVGPQYELKSPTFELKTGSRSFFNKNHEEDVDTDSLSERSFKTKGTHSSHSKGVSKGGQFSPNTKSFNMGGQKESRFSESSSKKVQYESSVDGSPVIVPNTFENKNTNGNGWSASPCQEEIFESSEDGSPTKGDEDCETFHDTSSQQDGLAGAVKLFALALERVQRKIHSSTTRQSAEILLSVSNNIHSQLQNAESKIQNDVGKLTNLGKSKRTRPENQCQEQQEQLKRIYEKFKEEVDQHLEKCRSTLEGLEAHDAEIRGVIEKQRMSHKKLLKQTEEAIEAQLNDAQKRLTNVHRVAREKMVKLKYGIAECLKEGLLG